MQEKAIKIRNTCALYARRSIISTEETNWDMKSTNALQARSLLVNCVGKNTLRKKRCAHILLWNMTMLCLRLKMFNFLLFLFPFVFPSWFLVVTQLLVIKFSYTWVKTWIVSCIFKFIIVDFYRIDKTLVWWFLIGFDLFSNTSAKSKERFFILIIGRLVKIFVRTDLCQNC